MTMTKKTKFIPFSNKDTESYRFLQADGYVASRIAVVGNDNVSDFTRISNEEVAKFKDYIADDYTPSTLVKVFFWDKDGIHIDYTDLEDPKLINMIDTLPVVAKISSYRHRHTDEVLSISGFGIVS